MLIEYRGEVYGSVSVDDPLVAGRARRGVYRWTGVSWDESGDARADVGYVWNDELLIGGSFTYVNGAPAGGFARFDGSEWTGFCPGYGVGGADYTVVDDFAVWGDKLVVLGRFDVAGCARSRGVAVWDGSRWLPLSHGVENVGRAAVGYEGDLIVGGQFYSVDDLYVGHIARWDGNGWSALGTGVSGPNDSGSVRSLAVYRGDLYAVGPFTTAGTAQAHYVARWDGETWSSVGGGLETSAQFPVLHLIVWNDRLVVGGDFYAAGGEVAKSLAAWDGQSWQEIGGGVEGGLATNVTTYDGDLLVSGTFTSAGGTGIDRLARWTGSTWIDEGATLPADIEFNVARVAPVGDVLYASARYGHAMRRVEDQWEFLAYDPLNLVYTCIHYGDGVYFGGDFVGITAGDKSSKVARWDLDPPTPIEPTTHEVPPGFQGTLLVLPPRPNPTDGVIRISFGIDHVGIVETRVFDAAGRLVRDLSASDTYAPGTHTLEWDGRTESDRAVPDGVYFARISSAGESETRKIVISR